MIVAVTVALAVVTGLPLTSSIATETFPGDAPLAIVVAGWTRMPILLMAPGVSVMDADFADESPESVNVKVNGPLVMRPVSVRFVNVATPPTAFTTSVPPSVANAPVTEAVTLVVFVVMALPPKSWMATFTVPREPPFTRVPTG